MKCTRGFTLIEILVALAIVAVALAAGTQASSALVRNAQRQTDVLLGQLCAENELSRLRLARQLPNTGDTSTPCTQAGRSYEVRVQVRPTPNPSFRRVDARVVDTQADTPVHVVNIATIMGRY